MMTKSGRKKTVEIIFEDSDDDVDEIKTEIKTVKASGKRNVPLDINSIFNTDSPDEWERYYEEIMDKKYSKGGRNYSKVIKGKEYSSSEKPPIFLIPRQRGGPSYKDIDLKGIEDIDDVFFAPISKGYPMQDVSSFTVGPIIGEGLCLVNAAFSKSVCIMHIEGGGVVDLKRKSFWKASKTPRRKISLISDEEMKVDGKCVKIFDWLEENEDLWLEEWEKWRRSIALCSMGDFHWTNDSPRVGFRFRDRYIKFVEWKIECYVKPSYDILPSIGVFKFLKKIWKDKKIPLGLVHPKAKEGVKEYPITKEFISNLFTSDKMCCQPYVVAGLLMGVELPVDF